MKHKVTQVMWLDKGCPFEEELKYEVEEYFKIGYAYSYRSDLSDEYIQLKVTIADSDLFKELFNY